MAKGRRITIAQQERCLYAGLSSRQGAMLRRADMYSVEKRSKVANAVDKFLKLIANVEQENERQELFIELSKKLNTK